MNYQKILSSKKELSGMKYDLSRMIKAKKIFPIKNFKIIHVAGTNGKGSTAKMISSIISSSYDVGLFTSPHLISINERIQVNNNPITDSELEEIVSEVNKLMPELTFFELLTVCAMIYFTRKQVSYVVLECGLGGRLDATNVFDADISVLTAISKDHEKILGPGITNIVLEKTGIIKSSSVVFCTKQNISFKEIITGVCKEKSAELRWVGADCESSLKGRWQKFNSALARSVCEHLGFEKQVITRRLRYVVCQGRFQIINNIILDGAHNEQALRLLGEEISFQGLKPIVIFGTSRNRIFNVSSLIPHSEIIFTKSSNDCATPIELFDDFEGVKIPDLRNAINYANKKGGCVLITGSLYLVADALKILL